MKNMKLLKLSLISHRERRARRETFNPEMTVILGENDVGKSHLIKSIYAAFGADPDIVNDRWKRAEAIAAVEFTVDEVAYTVVRVGNQVALFDVDRRLLWNETALVREIGPRLAELFDFKIALPKKNEVLVVPPPQFFFLPFYQDQDRGWNDNWASFKGLNMLPNFRKNLLEYHTGIRPKEYYAAKAEKAEAQRQQADLKAERRALDRASERLQARRTSLGVPFEPEQFVEQIDRLLVQLNEVNRTYEGTRKKIGDLQSSRAVLVEQMQIAGSALQELDADFQFMQDVTDAEIVCPTCHAVYDNDFAGRFSLIGDADACRGFLANARKSLGEVEKDIEAEKRSLAEYRGVSHRIEGILAETRGEIKLRDMLEDESGRILDVTIADERSAIQERMSEWMGKERAAQEAMDRYSSAARKKEIIKFYSDKLAQFSAKLDVTFSDGVAKDVAPRIKETGSFGTRAMLAYQYAIIHTINKFTTASLAPIVLDTPLQQDQDTQNADAILRFIRDQRPANMQVILGTVSLHGVDYPGKKITPELKHSLLNEESYDEVSADIMPLFDQMMGTSPGGNLLL